MLEVAVVAVVAAVVARKAAVAAKKATGTAAAPQEMVADAVAEVG